MKSFYFNGKKKAFEHLLVRDTVISDGGYVFFHANSYLDEEIDDLSGDLLYRNIHYTSEYSVRTTLERTSEDTANVEIVESDGNVESRLKSFCRKIR